MLGFDKRAARSTWTAALVLLLLYVVYLARKTLFVFTLALLFAYVLAPLVNLLDRIFPARRTRTAALALAFVIVVAIVGALGYLLGVRVVDEASVLARRFPTMVEKPRRAGGRRGFGARPEVSHHGGELAAPAAQRPFDESADRGKGPLRSGDAFAEPDLRAAAVCAAASGRSQQPHLRSDHTRPGVFLPEGRDDHAGALSRSAGGGPAPRAARRRNLRREPAAGALHARAVPALGSGVRDVRHFLLRNANAVCDSAGGRRRPAGIHSHAGPGHRHRADPYRGQSGRRELGADCGVCGAVPRGSGLRGLAAPDGGRGAAATPAGAVRCVRRRGDRWHPGDLPFGAGAGDGADRVPAHSQGAPERPAGSSVDQ